MPEVRRDELGIFRGKVSRNMKIFLSWSGPSSKQVAEALRDWLPDAIQALEPWMSSEDIEKGARWSSEIAEQLVATKAGIVCVTPENQNAPWLNFEAGALSKTVEKEMVCPYLFRMKSSEMTGPLVQFQAAEANKEDTFKLLSTLNRAIAPKALSEAKLQDAFELWWPKLEARMSMIKVAGLATSRKRTDEDMLGEILDIAREQARTSSQVAGILRKMELRYTLDKVARKSRSILEEFSATSDQAPPNNLSMLQELLNTPMISTLTAPGKLSDYDPQPERDGLKVGVQDSPVPKSEGPGAPS